MQLSSIMCRAQEARQHALAAHTSLANARGIATLAAAAWAKEALAAEKRELRTARTKAEAAILRLDPPALHDRSFSQNPDRGHADGEALRG